MKHRKLLLPLLLLLLALATSTALAMGSDNFRLDWFVPITSGGGGVASSPHFTADISVGQVAVTNAASLHYRANLGYWVPRTHYNRIPLVPHNEPPMP